jgi:hypothetical protein
VVAEAQVRNVSAQRVERHCLARGHGLPRECPVVEADVLLSGGFFLGGPLLQGADPGPGILAVPLGTVLLITAAVLVVPPTGRPGTP